MSKLAGLAACAGNWRGVNKLWYPENEAPKESAATAKVTPVLGGKFLRFDYTWGFEGTEQEGSFLIGCQSKTGALTGQWIDSWHMGEAVMSCSGDCPSGETLVVRGSYAAPPGPDWGWRIEITPNEGRTLLMRMFNISPGGQDMAAAEASFERA